MAMEYERLNIIKYIHLLFYKAHLFPHLLISAASNTLTVSSDKGKEFRDTDFMYCQNTNQSFQGEIRSAIFNSPVLNGRQSEFKSKTFYRGISFARSKVTQSAAYAYQQCFKLWLFHNNKFLSTIHSRNLPVR
jgi:hypothetical protein